MMSMHKEYNGRIHQLPLVSLPNNTKFNIALICVGELRSFAYIEKSWERYFLKEWKNHIKIFGHIVQTNNCPLSAYGLHRFSKLATEYELSSNTALIPSRDIFKRMPACLTTPEYFPRWQRRFGGFSRGNFVDMHTRRKRGYEMARRYAELHEFEWDLIFFLRLDTGLYEPSLNFYSIYEAITQYESSYGNPGIFVPGSCNYGGVCDRLAIGKPKSMDIYFQGDWTFDVMDMSCSSPNETLYLLDIIAKDKYADYIPSLETIRLLKEDLTVHVPTSEQILSLWFLMNNITQLNYDREIAFATVRTEHAKAYCSLTREDFSHNYPNGTTFLWDADKHSMYSHTSPIKDFDLIANYEQRCGNHTLHFDPDKICHSYPSCSCLKPFGHLYLGVE